MGNTIEQEQIEKFHELLFGWWQGENRRELPWRETENPYHVMISEFMLQQTQVSRVIPKYLAFIDEFPTVEDLAQADKSHVIELWQGLGYNRRAIWLQNAAVILDELGYFPRERKELEKIKGIGPYSSRSIPIFAFNAEYAAVDTNIRRILIYFDFISEGDKPSKIQKVADLLVPEGKSRDYHNAMMDFGSTELTASKTGIKSTSSQAKFENSDRQVRGKINSLLIDEKQIPIEELYHKITKATKLDSRNRFDSIMQKLETEGMIEIDNGECQLPS